MPWVPFTNDIAPRNYSVDLSFGWILSEDVDEYKKGKVITREIVKDLKSKGIKNIPVRFRDIKPGDQIRTPMSGEIFIIQEVNGKKKSRKCVIERLGEFEPGYGGPFTYSAPEFDIEKKKKKKNYKGDLAHWEIWVDDDEGDEASLGYEPEPETEDEEDDDLWGL